MSVSEGGRGFGDVGLKCIAEWDERASERGQRVGREAQQGERRAARGWRKAKMETELEDGSGGRGEDEAESSGR